jgi:PhnB protein
MPTLNPYLNFNGNTEEAFNFYKSVFGGEFPMVMRFGDAPGEFRGSESEKQKIMHISLPIGKNSVLMGSDSPQSSNRPVIGSNVHISISTESKEEADKIFNGLSRDGQVVMPIANTFWGSYFGMLSDKFGIHWMVSFDGQRPSA